MVKKNTSQETPEDIELIEAIRTSAHLIWQAGLGAFSRAQDEGGDLFARLVQQGTDLQKQTQRLADDKRLGVSDSVTKLAENVGKQASGSWEKIEKVFEDRVSRSLRSLGVPTRSDIQALGRKLDELKASIEAMAAPKPPEVKQAEKAVSKKRATKAVESKPEKAAGKREKSATAKGAARPVAKKLSRAASSSQA